MSEHIHLKVSLPVFSRLQKIAVPLIDTPDTVLERLLDALEKQESRQDQGLASQSLFAPSPQIRVLHTERQLREQNASQMQTASVPVDPMEYNRSILKLEEETLHEPAAPMPSDMVSPPPVQAQVQVPVAGETPVQYGAEAQPADTPALSLHEMAAGQPLDEPPLAIAQNMKPQEIEEDNRRLRELMSGLGVTRR
jgi:hypothetical protein